MNKWKERGKPPVKNDKLFMWIAHPTEGGHNFANLKSGLWVVIPFQRIQKGVQYGKKEKESNSTVEKPDKHNLWQVSKVNINSDKPYGQYKPLI